MAAIIAALLSLVDHGITALVAARKAAQQSGEWTDEQSQQFDAVMAKAQTARAWRTDEELGIKPENMTE